MLVFRAKHYICIPVQVPFTNILSNINHLLFRKVAALTINIEFVFQELGGLHAFQAASKLVQELNLGDIEADTWRESSFNGSCPSVLVDWCKPNKVRVVTCKDVSITNYLEAHETVMKIKYKETSALHSNNTYMLREAPRFSGKIDKNIFSPRLHKLIYFILEYAYVKRNFQFSIIIPFSSLLL